MFNQPSAVTIQDVAKAAGVSVSTVSRVINGKVDVAQATRERVLSVIEDLGYTSNLAARSMRSQKNNLIGLVVPDIGFPYSIEIMKGINRAIAESPYDLLVYTSGKGKIGEANHEQQFATLLNNSITDGAIIVASAAPRLVTSRPVVAVDPHTIDPDYPYVQGSNYLGALEIMEYLIGLGHRRIAFIGGSPEISIAGRRQMGYQDALKNAGLEVDDTLILPGDFTSRSGYEGTMKLLQLDSPPTAIFAANDQTALGVLEAAAELDLTIPDDLSVTGFDNITEARYVGLTTIDQSLSEMGYIATQMLIRMIEDQPVESPIYKMPTKLVIRNSCKPVQAAGRTT